LKLVELESTGLVMTLLGRFKNEMGECYHLMPVLSVTPQGLQPGLWVERVLSAYSEWIVRSGYIFCNVDGTRGIIKSLEPRFYERLEQAQREEPHLLTQK
jgi:hypothetical protein